MGKIILGVIVLVFLLVVVAIAIYLGHIAVYGYRQTLDESWQWQQEHVRQSRTYRRDMFRDYTIEASDGGVIHATLLPTDAKTTDANAAGTSAADADRYVILVHGYTDNRFGMMKYAPFYHEMGYHCVLFDQRGHGENAKDTCSYGPKEAAWLRDVLCDTRKRYGENITIGLHGESLGGATVLEAMKYPEVQKHVAFVVDDCGFAEIVPVLKDFLKSYHLPAWMVCPAMLSAKFFHGISLRNARPIDAMTGTTIPLLIIHGEKDTFITPDHSDRVYAAAIGPKQLHFIKDATHAQSAVDRPEEYREILREFLQGVFEGVPGGASRSAT